MIQLNNITEEPIQLHTIPLDFSDNDLKLTIRFYPTIQAWYVDVEWNKNFVKGVKLSLGVLHILSSNLPFDIVVGDTSGNGIDPFRIDDFVAGRCTIGILNNEEIASIRGVTVET